MTFTRVCLDTNVLVRALEGEPTDDVAAGLVGALGLGLQREKQAFVTSLLTLSEMLVHPYRRKDAIAVARYSLLLGTSSPWLQVVPVSRAVLLAAAELRASTRLKLADAIHVATGLVAGCSHILTSDRDIAAAIALDEARRIETIRPTLAVIDDLVAWLGR